MRLKLTLAMLSAVIMIGVLDHARTVHATPAHAQGLCSVASLKGTYAFRNTGVDHTVGGPIGEIGIAFFNGDGKRGFVRRSSSFNGVIQDWTDAPPPNGTYTVDSDCTGSFINPAGVKSYNIVVLDGGKRFLLLALEPDTIVTAEVTRIDPED